MTGFALNGTNLRNLGYNIRVVDGWDVFPDARVAVTQYPYRHGEILADEMFYEAKDISLGMVVLPYDPVSGLQTLTPTQHIQANVDALYRLFGTPGLSSLIRTMPDGTQREAEVKVIQSIDAAQHVGDSRTFVVRMHMPIPFWRQLPIANFSGSGTLVNNGNAPIQDFKITFGGAGSVTHGTTGDSITATGAVVVDFKRQKIHVSESDADNLVTFNTPWMFRLFPGNNSISGSASIDYYHSWF